MRRDKRANVGQTENEGSTMIYDLKKQAIDFMPHGRSLHFVGRTCHHECQFHFLRNHAQHKLHGIVTIKVDV